SWARFGAHSVVSTMRTTRQGARPPKRARGESNTRPAGSKPDERNVVAQAISAQGTNPLPQEVPGEQRSEQRQLGATKGSSGGARSGRRAADQPHRTGQSHARTVHIGRERFVEGGGGGRDDLC